MRHVLFWSGALLGLALSSSTSSQTMTIGIPPVKSLSEHYVFDTAEERGVKVSVIVKFERPPYDLAFLPNGDLLVVQRGVDLRIVRDATSANPMLDPKPIEGLPSKAENGEPFELLDVTLHPKFKVNHLIYFCGNYIVPEGKWQGRIALMRGKLENGRVSGVKTLLTTDEVSYAGGSRLQFATDGTLYMTTGAPHGDRAQRLDSIYGKVLRINDDGSIPRDNPFVGRQGARPEVYTYGHRDQIGLALQPGTGFLLTTEHGPSGGDEVNVIQAGKNYGWPTYSYGREYSGSPISDLPVGPGTEKPLLAWLPGIAPSGLNFYEGDKFPAWKGNLFVTSARRGEINNTGGIERVVFNSSLQELRREMLFTDLRQRFRDVVQGPDGLLYALVERGQNALLRIEPGAPGK